MAKENQRVALSRRLLKEALIELLHHKCIHNISIRELCTTAGINRTTFYRHYQTPADVFLELQMEFVSDFQRTHPLPGSPDGMRRYSSALCGYLYEHRDTARLFLRSHTSADFAVLFARLSQEFFTARTVLYKGSPIDEDTRRLICTLFSQGLYAVVRQWILEDVPKSPEEMAELICGFFIQDFRIQH